MKLYLNEYQQCLHGTDHVQYGHLNVGFVLVGFVLTIPVFSFLSASGRHQCCVLEQAGSAHSGLCKPQWESSCVGPEEE